MSILCIQHKTCVDLDCPYHMNWFITNNNDPIMATHKNYPRGINTCREINKPKKPKIIKINLPFDSTEEYRDE